MTQTDDSFVLVVDDEPAMCKVLTGILAQERIPCVSASSGEAALEILNTREVAVVISDLKMPGMDGLELLGKALEIDPTTQVILITAHGTAEIGQKAWELGAAGYVRKPFERDEIVFEVRRALGKHEAARPEASGPVLGGMIGRSPKMKEVQDLIAKVAPTSSTVLIRGESGTGKELVARALHGGSKRGAKAFIKVVCAALPETLIESELFGYEKGAFTGAAASKPGRFELADGGTIFLDEIGDLSPATQVKLLRILQDRQFERLGGTETQRVDVRVVAATHRDLETLKKEGKFREDLFYRISVVPITVAPLRERREDVRELAEYFVRQFCKEHGKVVVLDPRAIDALKAHAWPGNVRELQNMIERLVVLSSGTITEADARAALPAGEPAAAVGSSLGASRMEAEKAAVQAALAETRGNRTQAAKRLGVSRRTLHNKLREYGVE
ncbi:MAG: sigma-54-dependent Fis family transcriptional regulator [Planctomycetes bacterium]|nr:sigma-54-dependent Fis family transcriptional regulator [Planctomycetota bacterium]